MIIGIVTATPEAVIDLVVRGPNGQTDVTERSKSSTLETL